MNAERVSEEEVTDMSLQLSSELVLPVEAGTKVFGIFAQRGAGKTYTALVNTEEMVKRGLFVGYIDPLGVAWGLRSSADGEKPGYPVLILGGRHGDLPLDYTAGKIVAQFVMELRQPFILDLSLFEEQDQQCQFVADFINGFRTYDMVLLHLVVDEADLFAPQIPESQQERRSLKAMNSLTRRYRSKGFGATLISQRPAVINKNILSQVDVLIALRLISPQDIAALDEWTKRNATKNEREEFLASVSSLPNGTGWIWSPQWLHLFKKVSIRERETFDSSVTPTVGVELQPPKQLAEIDLTQISGQLTALTESMLETDTDFLQARIRELEERVQGERGERSHTPHGSKEMRTTGGSSSEITSLAGQVQSLKTQNTVLQEENARLRDEVTEKDRQLGAYQVVTTADQRLQAERLQASNVNIEFAEIHHFNAGVGVQPRPEQHTLEQENTVAITMIQEEIAPRAIALTSVDERRLEELKRRITQLPALAKKLLHLLYAHKGSLSREDAILELDVSRVKFAEDAPHNVLVKKKFIALSKRGNKHYYTLALADVLQRMFSDRYETDELLKLLFEKE